MIGVVAVAIAALVPPPQHMLKNPKALYGAAVYKALVGDAQSALRLLQESSAPSPQQPSTRRASACTASPRG